MNNKTIIDVASKLTDGGDLSSMLPYVDPSEHSMFQAPVGQEHYRLLAHISKGIDNATIFDVGTNKGSSAIALAINPTNKVYTFDIVDNRKKLPTPSNVECVIGNIFKLDESTLVTQREHDLFALDMDNDTVNRYWARLLCSDLVMFDVDPHDGIQEHVFHHLLLLHKYRGVVIYDDIRLNQPMRDFWANIVQRKYDITPLGHGRYGAGTGIVDYSLC